MSLTAEVQKTNSEALAAFSIASLAYKSACAKYTRVRIATIAREAPTDEEVLWHHRAHTQFKQACKVYAQARAAWINAVRAELSLDVLSLTNEDLYTVTLETNDKAIRARQKENALAQSITQEEIDLQKSVLAARQSGSVKDAVLSVRADDPTFEDFSPL